MKKILFAIAFVMMVVIANAQSDGFFKSSDGGYSNRDGEGGSTGIMALPNHGADTDQTAPLGTGMLILTAMGAGYAIARRKK